MILEDLGSLNFKTLKRVLGTAENKHSLRTALAKRLAKMQLLFNKFDDADKLSDMQTRPLFCTSLVKR